MSRCTALLLLSCGLFQGSLAQLECATGWGQEVKVIPSDWINDGYCDCPLDGRDEPDTEACSGSSDWPGVRPSEQRASMTSECPQQPNLKLPLSRVRDGICDCCDGADEAEGVCEDICEEVLRAEREARLKLEQDFSIGHNKRKHDLFAFKKLREEKLSELEELEAQKLELKTDHLEKEMEELKQNYRGLRTKTMKQVVQKQSYLLDGLEIAEVIALAFHACQIAGEISHDKHDSCVALRLAGLDMGMTWADDDFENPDNMKFEMEDESSEAWANVLFENASKKKRGWKLQGNGRRRLDDYDGDYGGDMDYDESYYGDDYVGEDPYETDDDMTKDPPRRGRNKDKTEVTDPMDELSGEQKEIVEVVQNLPFSATRASFLARAKELLSDISKLLDANDEDLEEDKEEDSPENKEEEPSEKPIDPAAYTMLRRKLADQQSTIFKGFKWAASADLFFRSNEELDDDSIRQLAMGTLYYGNLSATQVWQILVHILDDSEMMEPDPETCASPWASACPPKTYKRGRTTLPAKPILKAGQAFCSAPTEDFANACAAQASEVEGEIPTSIPDGYYGYTAAAPRDDGDHLTSVFSPVDSLTVDKDNVQRLEKEKKDIERERKNLDKSITETWKDIGGRNGNEMGPNGELHGLSDKCFDMQAGKYTYEVCVFGQAKQKDSPKGAGTSLGRFTKMEVDDETGERVLYWENGQKCWNGPSRSATVYMTCGGETKVLSADEPDTCRYVLKMESHIACDEKFKERMGL